MALEKWQVEYLNDVGRLHEMTDEDSRILVARFGFEERSKESEAAFERLKTGSTKDVQLRFFDLGMMVARARMARGEHNGVSGDDVADAEEHPDIAAFSAMADEIMRTPDVRTLHGYAQVALLNAIQRAAEVAESPEDIRLLADAYLTLPIPGEDDLD